MTALRDMGHLCLVYVLVPAHWIARQSSPLEDNSFLDTSGNFPLSHFKPFLFWDFYFMINFCFTPYLSHHPVLPILPDHIAYIRHFFWLFHCFRFLSPVCCDPSPPFLVRRPRPPWPLLPTPLFFFSISGLILTPFFFWATPPHWPLFPKTIGLFFYSLSGLISTPFFFLVPTPLLKKKLDPTPGDLRPPPPGPLVPGLPTLLGPPARPRSPTPGPLSRGWGLWVGVAGGKGGRSLSYLILPYLEELSRSEWGWRPHFYYSG